MITNSIAKIVIIILIAMILVYFLFILEYEGNIKLSGKIVSENEWILEKRPDGSLISTLYDHKMNMIENMTTFQIERGDVFGFTVNKNILEKDFITTKDTIGIIQSSNSHLELADLEMQLAMAKGTLNINITGVKESIISQATKELELARERSNLQIKLFEKQATLFSKNLISEDELDNEKIIQRVYELQVKIAESNLSNLQSGSKPEQIEMIKEEMISIEKEIKILKNKIDDFTLLSPLDGIVHKTFSNDTIILIGSKEKIAFIPFDITYKNDIKIGQSVSIDYSNIGKIINGTIIEINKSVRYLNNSQTKVATVSVDSESQDLPINLILECKINTEDKSGFEHLLNFSKNVFN